MEITDEEHARFKEIEEVLRGVVSGTFTIVGAEKALEPVYKPLLDMNTIFSRWPVLGIQPLLVRSIGADTLEAYADREDALLGGDAPATRRMRECAKAERAIGS